MTFAPPNPGDSEGVVPGPDPETVAAYLAELRREGFRGDAAADRGTRTVHATDNSVYRVEPTAVLFPRDADDVALAVRLAAARRGAVSLTARGGATGTNGQSLTRGVVLDTSRHMCAVLDFDPLARTVTVQPGVVLDALNEYLRPHGLFFPPTVSTSSRATIGGMVATDASGKGSRVYGRTSRYVEAMDVVLSDGSSYRAGLLSPQDVERDCRRDGIAGAAVRETRRVVETHQALIEAVFPQMNRGLTGYNLKDVARPDGGLALPFLLAGSEGTLAVTTAVTLRVLPRPSCRALVVLGYGELSGALEHVRDLVGADPLAIEVLDDKVLDLARGDILWEQVGRVLGPAADRALGGLSFVEFAGDTQAEVAAGLARLDAAMETTPGRTLSLRRDVEDAQTVSSLWELRKKAVGLLGRLPGRRQGMPFVEDTAVPPERLPRYVEEFRAILDRHGLSYGMFGHADVGCLHVRPALDMADPADRDLIRTISDEVALLTKRHGGLIWGEHGRGFRGEFSPLFFGSELYGELCRIKAAFDPHDLFNPGKLARPMPDTVPDRIDAVPFRGARDAEVVEPYRGDVGGALACNGNGACHNVDRFDAMCPSFKVTGDRAQSPKGRASLLREWARLEGAADRGTAANGELEAIEAATYASLSTCLSCKACAHQCPVRVDIPAMRSRFLERYHARHRRPARHALLAVMEPLAAMASRVPGPANALLGSTWARAVLRRRFGLVDLPPLAARRPEAVLAKTALGSAAHISGQSSHPQVLLVQDGFTSRFDADVPVAATRLLTALGYDVRLAPVAANGKALHALGMRSRFANVAERARERHAALAAQGIPLVALDAVPALMHRHEYAEGSGNATEGPVTLDVFLSREIAEGRCASSRSSAAGGTGAYRVLLHCTERTASPGAGERWRSVFEAFGAVAETPATGCCGMAGLFGHEAEHRDLSHRIFEASWRERIEGTAPDRVLATGFSCRCQTERIAGFRPRHPAEALLDLVRTEGMHPC